LVDELLSVSPISTSLEGVPLGGKTSSGGSKLEGPQEVVGFLEVSADGVDLVDKVFNGVDVLLVQGLGDDFVIGKRNSLLVDLAETSLQDEFSDGFPRRIAESDVGLHSSEEVGGGLVDSHEDSVVDLSESQKSKDSKDLGVEFVNTSDPDDEGEFGLGRDMDLTSQLSLNRLMLTCLRAVISSELAFW
jgi:hypothetical protein